jgi:predicted 3'-5' exonuclease similar to PolB exonuclease domain
MHRQVGRLDQRRKIEELKEVLSRAPSAKASRSRNPYIQKIVITLANAAEEFAERLRQGAPQRSRFGSANAKIAGVDCETDVVGTYQGWLRYELFRGTLSQNAFEASQRNLADFMNRKANA